MPPALHLIVIELTITPKFGTASPLERLLRLLLSARKPPTVVLLRPIHTWWKDNAQQGHHTGACNYALLQSLAAHYGVAYVDEFSILTHDKNSSDTHYTFANLADKSGDLHPAALLVDSVHPTARGARLLGSALGRALHSMLRAAEDGLLPSMRSLPMPLSGGGGAASTHTSATSSETRPMRPARHPTRGVSPPLGRPSPSAATPTRAGTTCLTPASLEPSAPG